MYHIWRPLLLLFWLAQYLLHKSSCALPGCLFDIITCFTLKFHLLVRLCATTKRTSYHNFITNVTVQSCVEFSNVVVQHEPCIEFPVTYVTIRVMFFVVLSEVSFKTTFITEKCATFLAGDVISDVHRQKSLTWLKNGDCWSRINHFLFSFNRNVHERVLE